MLIFIFIIPRIKPEGRNFPPVAQNRTINLSTTTNQSTAPVCATFTFRTRAPMATPMIAITAPDTTAAIIRFTNTVELVFACG